MITAVKKPTKRSTTSRTPTRTTELARPRKAARLVPLNERSSGNSSALDRDWEQAAKDLARMEPEFIFHASFSQRRVATEILNALPASESAPGKVWKPGKEMPAHLVRLCESPLLKPEEEAALFRRMNYAKYRANMLRRRIDPREPDRDLILETEQLLQLAHADRDHIVRANLRLVVSIAKKFADARTTFDDLLSEGITSLLRAVEKFDFSRGFRFSTYATQAVRRTIFRALSNLQRERGRMVATETSELEDRPAEESDGTMTESRWAELRSALAEMLGQLDSREQAIIRRRFGLDHQQPITTLQNLAGELGVCKERVRQLEMRAIIKLREMAEQIDLAPSVDD